MITVNSIISELNNRGFNAEERTSIKNGIEKIGISVRQGNNSVAPMIYTDALLDKAEEEDWTVSEVADEIERIIVDCKPDFDLSVFTDKDFILSHMQIGLQREGTEDIIKRQCSKFEGLEEYLYISANTDNVGSYSVKMNSEILRNAEITIDEAWTEAEKHNNEDAVIKPLFSMIAEMMGEAEDIPEEVAPMYVISNTRQFRGASAILSSKVKELADRINVHKLVMLPSSIHECIIVPYEEGTDFENFNRMVSEVNCTTVEPEDVLIDRAYLIEA